MDNQNVFYYICLVVSLGYGYSIPIGNDGAIVFPDDFEKIKSQITVSINVHKTGSNVDPAVPTKIVQLSKEDVAENQIDSNVDPAALIIVPKLFEEDAEVSVTDSSADPAVPIEVPELSEDDAEQILDKLGFNITDNDDEVISTRFGGFWSVANKILRYQKYYGLPETGQFDTATKVSMKKPRCGGARNIAADGENYRWKKRSLTYYVRNSPSRISPNAVKQLLRRAFNEWSKVTVIDFAESNNPRADVEIVFGGRRHLDRGRTCREAFGDTTLAHATFPETGTVHFNTNYFFGSMGEHEFFNTAVHEIGHALGLDHSTSEASIMYPALITLYSELPQIDAQKIQRIYGKRSQVQSAARFCGLPKYDALFYYSGKLHIIAGKYYYTFADSSDAEPQLISKKWPGAPDSIDAAFSNNGRTYMFSGAKVWAFINGRLDTGYPRWIGNAFPGLPTHLDAVMFRRKFIFAFKNGLYWRFNISRKHVDDIGELSDFALPSGIDAAVYSESINHAFIYKDDEKYVIDFENVILRKSKNNWMRC